MIKIISNKVHFSSFVFPAGEIGVKVETSYNFDGTDIVARLRTSDDIMEFLMTIDALARKNIKPGNVLMPWCPYARQDRVCVPGESHSLRVFADLINRLNLNSLTILDPHSDVVGALFNNLKIVNQIDILGRFDKLNAFICNERPVFISPDAGANKKTAALASFYGHDYFVRADKLRDLTSGKIREIVVVNSKEDIEGKTCLICDDIADGAATFVGLAAALKAKGARKIVLYVTHGIWSKGTSHLFDGGIDEIYCTNSYRTDMDFRINVLDVEDGFCRNLT